MEKYNRVNYMSLDEVLNGTDEDAEEFRKSRETNVQCGLAINQGIAKWRRGETVGYEALPNVLDRYGAERVSMIIATMLQAHTGDGRISVDNSQWAESVAVPRSEMVRAQIVKCLDGNHIGIIDEVASWLRKAVA